MNDELTWEDRLFDPENRLTSAGYQRFQTFLICCPLIYIGIINILACFPSRLAVLQDPLLWTLIAISFLVAGICGTVGFFHDGSRLWALVSILTWPPTLLFWVVHMIPGTE